MKPFVEGAHAYKLRRVANGKTRHGYEVYWHRNWFGCWRWMRRDDIGFVATIQEAKYLIGLFEMQDGIARAHGVTE